MKKTACYHFDGFNEFYSLLNYSLINKKNEFSIKNEKRRLELVKCFYGLGYLASYEIKNKYITVYLKDYLLDTHFRKLKIISSPGRPIACSIKILNYYSKNYNNLILSTDKGLLTLTEAIKKNTGGIILFGFD